MPSMADITVQNAAAANVTYNAAAPSAGDKVPAVWRQNAASAIIGHRPTFSVVTRDNGNRNARQFSAVFRFPVVENIDSRDVITATVPLTVSGTLPTNVSNTEINDAFVQFGNLLVSALIRSVAQEGYAPT